jgi:hypothetical protein
MVDSFLSGSPLPQLPQFPDPTPVTNFELNPEIVVDPEIAIDSQIQNIPRFIQLPVGIQEKGLVRVTSLASGKVVEGDDELISFARRIMGLVENTSTTPMWRKERSRRSSFFALMFSINGYIDLFYLARFVDLVKVGLRE